MKYKITEVLPAQIKVEFEDNSWAIVPISPEASPEEIDIEVSKYDPDFLPKPDNLVNKNISIGEERTSKKEVLSTVENKEIVANQKLFENATLNLDFGIASPLNVLVLSKYYEERGDNRLKEALEDKIQLLVSNPNFSLDKLISDLSYNPEDIMIQAEAELNGLQS